MIDWVILGMGILLIILATSYYYWDSEAGWFLVVVFAAAWSCWHWWPTPEEQAAYDARKAAEQRARETPHVVREADGCKVYAFERDGRDHYFTRCPASTDTETTWTERCGKNCTRQKSENVVTHNK